MFTNYQTLTTKNKQLTNIYLKPRKYPSLSNLYLLGNKIHLLPMFEPEGEKTQPVNKIFL